MLGKVMDGQLGGLSRWGYSWTATEEKILKTGTSLEKAQVIAKVVTQSVGEMNYALAQTDVGRQKQLANTFADIKTQFGAAFNAYKAGIKQQIVDMAQNGSGTRDTGRVLHISKDTVTSVLKKQKSSLGKSTKSICENLTLTSQPT